KETTQTMRNLIALYIEDYMALTSIEKTPFVNAGSTASYEAIRITTAYKNNVSLRFGDNLCAAVNVLLRVREERERLRRDMEGQDQAAIRAAIREQITGPATLAKRAVMGGVSSMSVLNAATREALRPLEVVFATYPTDRVFVDNDVKADSQLHPEHHLKAFYVLAGVLQRHRDNRCTPQCFPLRRGWVPAHTHINMRILKRHIFNDGRNCSSKDFDKVWARAVNLEHRAFKPSSGKSFSWSIDTDGVAVSILKKTAAERDRYKGGRKLEEGQIAKPKRTQHHKRKRPPSDGDSEAPAYRGATPYIHQIPRQELIDMMGKCILLDPGRRDELHGLHEDSMPDHKMTFRPTHRQVVVQRCMARFRKILQTAKKQYTGGDVQEAKRELAKVSCTTLDPHEFEDYIVVRSRVWGLLSTFYSSTQTVHVGSHHQFHAKRTPLRAFIGPLSKTATRKTHQYLAHKPTNYPLHRKLCLSAYINKKRTDEWLVGELCQWFGQDVVLVIGNWSALMARFHEPQRGKGLRQMLVKQGFKVYLVDEFRTSMTCPTCEMATLTTFKDIPNPCPWRCAMQPI
ncbi:hypothetical protein H4R19_005846, partial [Coemansia spiralis]